MTPETFLKAQMVSFALQEGGLTGTRDTFLAILCVVRNRVKAGWFGGDWMQNLNHAWSRSAYEPITSRPVDLGHPALRRLLGDVEDIYTGVFKDELTCGGLYFLEPTYEKDGRTLNPWFVTNILGQLDRHQRVAQVATLWIFS